MKKGLKIALKILGIIVVLLLIGGLAGYFYIRSAFLDFEDDHAEKKQFERLEVDGYSFLDRNGNGSLDVYEDDRASIEDRANDALSMMTQEEKIHLLKGSGMKSGIGLREAGEGIPGAVGTIVPTPRLGLPTIYLSDGPAGLRLEPHREGEDRSYYCTAFPIATLLASTWNEDLVEEVGRAMGNEALEYGLDVILGPGVNIQRHPLCGRNFEYYSEDPFLTGKMGIAMVNGIEANGVGTSVKHFVANNQETRRNFNNAIISDRALREIYLKGFEMIVKEAQPWTIMSSYNKVNGTYVTESEFLLTDVLRGEWDFQGVVMSDWFGGNDAVAQINAGNDLLEPGTNKQWKALKNAGKTGELSEQAINTSAKRILKLIFNSKKMQGYAFSNDPDLNAHAKITRQSAAEGIVLLKNEHVLPLKSARNVALLGVTSYDFIAGGTGSGDVNEAYTISLEQGLENAGFTIEATAKEFYMDHFNAHKEAFVKPEGMWAMFQPYFPPQLVYSEDQLNRIAQSADVAIVTIGRNAGEGKDRVKEDDFLLSKEETDIIEKACKAFHERDKKVIVVLNISGVIETASWKEQPDAIVLAWQGGQEGGNSVADVLGGFVNPSGKLPITFANRLEDYLSNENFPLDGEELGLRDFFRTRDEKPVEDRVKNKDYTNYDEGIYVGYRGFDKNNTEVSYPFGFGLSYTGFQLDSLSVQRENDSIKIQVSVENKGTVPGKEVVQVYFSKVDSHIDRPARELKGFAKTESLQPGESETLTIGIPVSALRYWDEKSSEWVLEQGDYIFHVGNSSRDLPLSYQISVQ